MRSLGLTVQLKIELMRGGEVVTHLAHTQEIVGSIPTLATKLVFPDSSVGRASDC